MSLENFIISFFLCLKLLFVFIVILLFFEVGTLKMFSMAVCNDHKKIIVKTLMKKIMDQVGYMGLRDSL